MPRPELTESRDRFLNSLERLDQRYKGLEQPEVYPALYTFALSTMLNEQKHRAGKCHEYSSAAEPSCQSHRALAAVGNAFIFYERQRLMRFGPVAVNGNALELEAPRRIEDLPHIVW